MAEAYDYVNDKALSAALPLATRRRMQRIQQARMDAGHTSKDGRTYRTAEKARFMDDLCGWKRRGCPADELASLKAREAELREQSKF